MTNGRTNQAAMQALMDYLYMDGYWPFIWSAYGVTAAVLLALLLASLRSLRANERAVADLEGSRSRRGRPRTSDAADDA